MTADPLAEYGPAIKSQCAASGHRWTFTGGRSCCCAKVGAGKSGCSLPVHVCDVCKECDYGDNDESKRIVDRCYGGASD